MIGSHEIGRGILVHGGGGRDPSTVDLDPVHPDREGVISSEIVMATCISQTLSVTCIYNTISL